MFETSSVVLNNELQEEAAGADGAGGAPPEVEGDEATAAIASSANNEATIAHADAVDHTDAPIAANEIGDSFPSQYLCPYLHNEPPVDGAYFNIRGSNGRLSPQVFEYSRIYRHISTLSTGRAYRMVRHPINGGWVPRATALGLIQRVSAETQELLNAERVRRNLDLEDDDPLVDADYVLYNRAMSRVGNSATDVREIIGDDIVDPPAPVIVIDNNIGTNGSITIPPPRRGVSNVSSTQQRIPLGSFLNQAETEIRSANHATALIGLIQLGAGHEDGISGAFGHNNRSTWFRANTDALFMEDGPLGRYVPVSPRVLMRHVGRAQVLARSFYDRDHSNEQSGAGHEDVPEWARHFFDVFQAQDNQIPVNAQAAAARNERRSVVASIAGAQAPLGFQGSSVHAQLRTETSRNNDAPRMRQQVVGVVNSKVVVIDGDGDEDQGLVEGRDDTSRRRSAPRRRTGIHHRNIHAGVRFSPQNNDPSSRFYSIQHGYASLEALTRAVVESVASPPRRMIDIAREYQEVNHMLASATTDRERMWYNNVLERLNNEMSPSGTENAASNIEGHN